MIISKNTFGVSYVLNPKVSNPENINTFGGSSLNRQKTATEKKEKDQIAEQLKKPLVDAESTNKIRLRSMSKRTRSKIREKIMAFGRIHPKLTFLTLTFVNQVEDQIAIKILRTFLDNAKKRLQGFEYIWVAERQTNNEVFKDNIHFHLITNKFWKIDKWWPYWLDIQTKYGIKPREENFRPGSAFNVKRVDARNTKQIGSYLTKYLTKTESKFKCQVWNCSKKISRLYTCFYSGMQFIRHIEKLNESGQLGGELKVYPQDYCNVLVLPLNRLTVNLYNRIDDENRKQWDAEDASRNNKKQTN
jgi:hypothetical protein